MVLQRAVQRGREVDHFPLLVHGRQPGDLPWPLGQRSDQPAVAIVQVQVHEAIPFGPPDKAAAVLLVAFL